MSMHDIKQMLRLNLEIEGCLRILLDRPNAEAEELLVDKIDQLRSLASPQPSEAPKPDEPADNPKPADGPEPACNPEPANTPEPANNSQPVIRVENALTQQAAFNFAKAFSINDKYRFIREIFDNSAPAFNNAIDMVGTMQSLDEAYDYFLNDLGWDADNEAVSDYLVIVANHFNSAQ